MLLKSLHCQLMLSLYILLCLAFLYFCHKQLHVLVLTHTLENISSDIEQRGVRSHATAVELT